jgi:hypothetical protein
MKPTIALVALFLSACAGSTTDPDPVVVTPPPPAPPAPAPAPDGGEWGTKANLLVNNSEFALAESNGKLYVLGGYPPSRQTARTVQVYDIATDRWQLGPELPQPNNHGMAAAVAGKVYLIGGQVTDDQQGATAVNTVYELDPARGTWVEKAPMPTARSGGVAVAHAAGSTSPGDACRAATTSPPTTRRPTGGRCCRPAQPAQPHHRRGDQRPHPHRRRAPRQRPVAREVGCARGLRPTDADLDDRGPHAARPQRDERASRPGAASTSGAARRRPG